MIPIICSTCACTLSRFSLTLCNPMDCSLPGSSVHVDSLGKNTGVGCNALLQGIFPTKGSNQHLLQVPHESEDAHSCPTLCNPMEPARLPCPWDFPGKNTGVGCHFLLQGIFLTQGSNSGLPHCRQTLYHLSHLGIPSFLHSREILYP